MKLEFAAYFGDEKKKVELLNPNGAGGDSWQVMIDNYYRGIIFKKNGEWVSYSQWLTIDDVQILGQMIDELV